MKSYLTMTKDELLAELAAANAQYEDEKKKGYNLDMSRGKPAPIQLDLSMAMLEQDSSELIHSRTGADVRNYGEPAGIADARELFADLLGVKAENIIVGGQSSLNLMYDCFIRAMVLGVYGGSKPWGQQGMIKFLCPVPGYDRHFRISQEFGAEMINIPMTPAGPDMDMVRRYVENDPAVKGIWCVPKYSNPQGYTCSPETVEAFAALQPAADDFRIFWDNAYLIHGFRDEDDYLLNIFDACEKYGSEDMVYEFASTSKMSFPGAGVAVIAASKNNVDFLLKQIAVQTIGYDKINQLRHAKFFGSADGLKAHMKKHAEFIRPKFDCTLAALREGLDGLDIAEWTSPNGGYFISFNGLPGTAKRCVSLCKGIGVKLTGAGAPYPYGIDPEDKNIRIAPSFPTIEQLALSMKAFCICQRIAALEVLLAKE